VTGAPVTSPLTALAPSLVWSEEPRPVSPLVNDRRGRENDLAVSRAKRDRRPDSHATVAR
jgi:hypothetical protein